MNILVVVDMQNDFITGSLGTPEANIIVPRVMDKIQNFDGEVLFTKDTHPEEYMATQEGHNLPVPHCIEHTPGWQLHPLIERYCKITPINKPTFGSVQLGQILQAFNKEEPLESITLVGLCTDICVISNALLIKAFLPEVPIIVDASCCAGVTPESHTRALEAMETCQIKVINK